MSWLIDSREEEPISLSRYIASSIHGDDKKNAITGLTGLIRLGGAWQSTDVYLAIASLYYYPEQSMAGIAKLRAKEIYDNGGKSMDPGFKDFESESSDVLDHPSLDEHEISEFKRLRDIADKWNADREAFMLRKLEKGDHPDTDPHFWDGSPTLPPLTVHQSVGSWFRHDVLTMEHEAWFGLAVCFGSTILIVYAVVRARRNYNQRIGKGPIQN